MVNPTHGNGDTVLFVPANGCPPVGSTKKQISNLAPIVTAGEHFPAVDGIGRFLVLAEIARGGMGVILRAHDVKLNRRVALKVLLHEHADESLLKQRFVEEAQIMGDLQHPGVVPIFEAGELGDGRPFFAMKLVEGDSLTDLLDRRSSPQHDLPQFLRTLERVCQTIAFAHTRGVIHRDLKPLNVMVGVYGEVLVMDWGLSKRLANPREHDDSASDQPLPRADGLTMPPMTTPQTQAESDDSGDKTRTGSVLGTPSYLSPEQARGHSESCDERVDVFGLGAILCEILTGKPPYWDADPRSVLAQAIAANLGPARERLAHCGANRELVALATWCLAPECDDRPKNAGIVAEILARYLDASLRIAETDLSRFFELSLDLFCIATVDGFFRRVNANFSRVLGYTEAELLSQPFVNFVHPEDVESTYAAVDRLVAGLPVAAFRNRYRDAFGNYRWFEWTAKSAPDEGLIFAVARDVTPPDDEELAGHHPTARVKPR